MNQLDFRIRTASSDDVEAIMKALESLSDEIPLKIETEESRKALREIVVDCCRQNSWVALDKADHVVGFLLEEIHQSAIRIRV
jgi:hypothetical protein